MNTNTNDNVMTLAVELESIALKGLQFDIDHPGAEDVESVYIEPTPLPTVDADDEPIDEREQPIGEVILSPKAKVIGGALFEAKMKFLESLKGENQAAGRKLIDVDLLDEELNQRREDQRTAQLLAPETETASGEDWNNKE